MHYKELTGCSQDVHVTPNSVYKNEYVHKYNVNTGTSPMGKCPLRLEISDKCNFTLLSTTEPPMLTGKR